MRTTIANYLTDEASSVQEENVVIFKKSNKVDSAKHENEKNSSPKNTVL